MVNAIISTIVRNDESYLDEWIAYNFSLGFEKIVIYDHKSDIALTPKWGENVYVYRVDRTNPHVPDILHNYTMKEVKSRWIYLCDVDEFLVLYKHSNIHDFIKEYQSYGGVSINYVFYGSSGYKTRPKGNVKDNYTWRTDPNHQRNQVSKCILQTEFTRDIINQHTGITKRPIVNQDFELWNGAGQNSSRSRARINHYYTRSLEEWKRKVVMGNKEKWQVPRDVNFIYELDRACTIKDEILVGR